MAFDDGQGRSPGNLVSLMEQMKRGHLNLVVDVSGHLSRPFEGGPIWQVQGPTLRSRCFPGSESPGYYPTATQHHHQAPDAAGQVTKSLTLTSSLSFQIPGLASGAPSGFGIPADGLHLEPLDAPFQRHTTTQNGTNPAPASARLQPGTRLP